jgi:polysaccharide biosynthesis protein PslH
MRILFVTPYSPFASAFGGQQRTKLLYDALCEIASTVDVLLIENKDRYAAEVVSTSPLTVRATLRVTNLDVTPFSTDARLMRQLAGVLDLDAYDLICGRYIRPFAKIAIPPGVATIVDLDDMSYSYASEGTQLSRVLSRAKSGVRRMLEERALHRYSAFWFVSERDRARHPSLAGTILPNIPVQTLPDVPPQPAAHRVLFVGALWYGPNREGIERFLAQSWPLVRHAVPDATLRLVGGAPPEDRARWASAPGVEAPGFVPDLVAEYRDASLCVAPIHSGGGTNIKILEAFAFGRACVTTTFCKRAFAPHFDDGDTLAHGDGDHALAEQCVRLLRDSERCATMARNGHRIVSEVFNLRNFRHAVRDGIARVRERAPRLQASSAAEMPR